MPDCIGSLARLNQLDLAGNFMTGIAPDSIGQLIMLEYLYLGWDKNTNKFEGPLPRSMSNLVNLKELYLNVGTITGALPDFSQLILLEDCDFYPSQLCIIPEFVPVGIICGFTSLPECPPNSDCLVLSDWLPNLFDSYYFCCQVDGVYCEDDRVINLDLSFSTTGITINGTIPSSVGDLDKLQNLNLKGNLLEGTLPISLANITSLVTVDIIGNYLSGVLLFLPSFNLIGIDTNSGLSLPIITSPTVISVVSNTAEEKSSGKSDTAMIAGISIAALVLIAFVVVFLILYKRRRQGIETDIELQIFPKYSSSSRKIRLKSKINSGGFGIVWKARYRGETVAMKLILMDKYKEKEGDGEAGFKIVKMVVDEAAIMKLMVHERIVKFIHFEIESLGIVLEYLPLGSLYDHIAGSRGVIPWPVRYQMMLDISEGMEFLHSNVYADGSTKQVLFHQDLKSANVLLCMEGSPKELRGKISDFGLSCTYTIPVNNYYSLEGQSDK
jgi:hypothetical protein